MLQELSNIVLSTAHGRTFVRHGLIKAAATSNTDQLDRRKVQCGARAHAHARAHARTRTRTRTHA